MTSKIFTLKICPKTLFAEQIYQGKKFCPALTALQGKQGRAK
jgi:hypothetical protein